MQITKVSPLEMQKKVSGSSDSKCPPSAVATASTPYLLPMPLWFILLSIGVGVMAPFFMGRIARSWLLSAYRLEPSSPQAFCYKNLPRPVLGPANRPPPSTLYTTKNFEAKGTSRESFLVRSVPFKDDDSLAKDECNTSSSKTRMFLTLDLSKSNLARKLSTEAHVVELLNKLVATSKDTVLSYHCHQEAPKRISCLGIAPHGHIALHTFSDRMTLNLYGIDLDQYYTMDILGQPLAQSHVPKAPPFAKASVLRQLSDVKAGQVASAFVHPAMFMLDKLEMIVLVGGSVLTLQQILLHKNVQRVVLLEMDSITQENCSPWCDLVVEVKFQSAREWLANQPDATADLIFIESFQQSPGDIVGDVGRVLNGMGLLVVKLEPLASKWLWTQELTEADQYEIIKDYQQGDTNFLMVLKSLQGLGRWFANVAEVDLAIRQRIGSPLLYFDGPTMQLYQYPSRVAEDEFCRANPEDYECKEGHGFDPSQDLVPISAFDVKLSTIANAGRGVYSKLDIEKGASIFVDVCVENIHIPDSTVRLIDDFAEGVYKNISKAKWKTLLWYTYGYGFVNVDYGSIAYDVDPGIGTFVNHGCNGTTNVGDQAYVNLTEFSVDFVEPYGKSIYNPPYDRALRTCGCATSIALRSIRKGEEIFNNYMTFVNPIESEGFAESLRNECSGKRVGQVSEYELSAQAKPEQRSTLNASNAKI